VFGKVFPVEIRSDLVPSGVLYTAVVTYAQERSILTLKGAKRPT